MFRSQDVKIESRPSCLEKNVPYENCCFNCLFLFVVVFEYVHPVMCVHLFLGGGSGIQGLVRPGGPTCSKPA